MFIPMPLMSTRPQLLFPRSRWILSPLLGGLLLVSNIPVVAAPPKPPVLSEFGSSTTNLEPLTEMLRTFHAGCHVGNAGTFHIQWLTPSLLWVGDASTADGSPTRKALRDRLTSMRLSREGYVSCHQHEGLAHTEGWPFPLTTQSAGFGFYFSLTKFHYDEKFAVSLTKDISGWELRGAKTLRLDGAVGWEIELTEPEATITSPGFDVDALVSPFVTIKWVASGLPKDVRPWLEWTTSSEKEFSPLRRVPFPEPSTSSTGEFQYFDIPIYKITKAKGRITRLRIGFGNPSPAKATLVRVFSSVDSRHNFNNANYLIAATNYFDWTGDRKWLVDNLEKMRRALGFMISEFSVREAHLLRTPWIGHDGRSGLDVDAKGKKTIHTGMGIGNNYWDILPFGGDDAYSTIYLYAALVRMARMEDFLAREWPDVPRPESDLDAKSLNKLAEAVRTKFQKTFWNPKTKRFAPIDETGTFRDFGFTFLNNEAIFYGLATDAQAGDILRWTDGERKVDSDTSQGEDIYHWRFAPRATTKRNLDYYIYPWSAPERIPFGDQVQDGGAVLGFTYHDLMARLRYLGPDNAWKRLGEIMDWWKDVQAEGGARTYYKTAGRGSLQGGGTAGGLGIDVEFYESILLPSVILDGFLGFAARPAGFALDPRLPAKAGKISIRGVSYRDMVWDVEAEGKAVAFHVRSGEVDAPLRIRLPEGAWQAVIRREGKEESIRIPHGKDGFLLAPGALGSLEIRPAG